MTCNDLECGFVELNAGCCGAIPLINNSLTKQFIDAAKANCTSPDFTGQGLGCHASKLEIAGLCDSWAPDPTLLHPGQEILNDDGTVAGYAAPWFDPNLPAVSGGVFGLLGISHSIGTSENFIGSTRNAIRARPRRTVRGVRIGVIEAVIVANGADSIAYFLEWLNNTLTQRNVDCPCYTDRLGAYRFCCGRDDTSGYRHVSEVGAWSIEVDDKQSYDCCTCRVTITYEAADPTLLKPVEAIACEPDVSEPMKFKACNDPTVDMEVSRQVPREVKSVKLLYNAATGETAVCGVDFDLATYDPDDGCVLEITAVEAAESTEVAEKVYLIDVNQAQDGSLTFDQVHPSIWPTDGSVPCDGLITIRNFTYYNDEYVAPVIVNGTVTNPEDLCPDCFKAETENEVTVNVPLDEQCDEIPDRCKEFITVQAAPVDGACLYFSLDIAAGVFVPLFDPVADDWLSAQLLIDPASCGGTAIADQLCTPFVPAEACVDLQLTPGESVGSWFPIGWELSSAWPGELPASQFNWCAQNTDPVEVTETITVAASDTSCVPPCNPLPSVRPTEVTESCWDKLCPPLHERQYVCTFDGLALGVAHALDVNITNGGAAVERVTVSVFGADPTQPDPVSDPDYWRCREPQSETRLLEIPSNTQFTVSGCGRAGSVDLYCGGTNMNGLPWTDGTQPFTPPVMCGTDTIYVVVSVPATCSTDDIVVSSTLTPLERF